MSDAEIIAVKWFMALFLAACIMALFALLSSLLGDDVGMDDDE